MKPAAPIDFSEAINREGLTVSVLVCHQLPAGFRCTITPNGRLFQRKTKANGNGSIRYHQHDTLEDARAAAVRWARRKMAEANR